MRLSGASHAPRLPRKLLPFEGRINRERLPSPAKLLNHLRRAIERLVFSAGGARGVARVFEDKGQYDEAILEFRKAIDQLRF